MPKSFIGSIGGDIIIKVNSKFTLNQISGQVIEHEESWDLSSSSPLAQVYFWVSRRLFAAKEGGKDVVDSVKDMSSKVSSSKENVDMYPDPSGDPTKVCILPLHVISVTKTYFHFFVDDFISSSQT